MKVSENLNDLPFSAFAGVTSILQIHREIYNPNLQGNKIS